MIYRFSYEHKKNVRSFIKHPNFWVKFNRDTWKQKENQFGKK